jgi:hypothetical protein
MVLSVSTSADSPAWLPTCSHCWPCSRMLCTACHDAEQGDKSGAVALSDHTIRLPPLSASNRGDRRRDRAFHDLRGALRPEIASTSLSFLGASWPNATVPVGAARRVGSGDVHRVLSREGDPARVVVALLGNWAGGVHAQAQQRHGAGCDRDSPLPHRRRRCWQPPRESVDGRTSWLARGLVSRASGVDVSCLCRKLEAAGEPRLRHNVGGRGAALREDW